MPYRRCSSACSVQANAIAAAIRGTVGPIHHAIGRASSRCLPFARIDATAISSELKRWLWPSWVSGTCAYNRAMATRLKHTETAAPRLSVVVLVFNEAESIAPLHAELIGVLDAMDTTYEVVYIDDGSRDGSTERLADLALTDPHVRVVSFRRNFGQTAAVQAGIDNSRGEILVFMDGDMQNDPHDIPRLLQKITEGNDVASGWRKDRHDDVARVLPSRTATVRDRTSR